MIKDSINAPARYALSTFFFSLQNTAFQIDSAYRYCLDAIQHFTITTLRDKERMRKFPLDSTMLVVLRTKIDSAAFERAKLIHTETAYIEFLVQFQFAAQRQLAIELRDEVAFSNALKTNTWQSFAHYLEKYPQSARAAEAKTRYHRRLYETKTQAGTRETFEAFVREHPESPHRAEAIRFIFNMATASGKVTAFEAFMSTYPRSHEANIARQLLIHSLWQLSKPMPATLLSDSLKHVIALQQAYLVPFAQSGRFGFMDETGKIIIPASVETLEEEYRCGDIVEDVVVMGDQLMGRNGSIIFRGAIDEYDDLGYGFLRIRSGDCTHIIHKSGFKPTDSCVDDARIENTFLVFSQRGKWGVMAFNGIILVEPSYTKIESEEDAIFFYQGDANVFIAHSEDVAAVANKKPLTFTLRVNSVKPWGKKQIAMSRGGMQAVYDTDLREKIPFAMQELTPDFFGIIARQQNRTILYTENYTAKPVDDFKSNKPWLAGKQNNTWQLYNPRTLTTSSPQFDSIGFVGAFAVGKRSDTLRVYLTEVSWVETTQQSKLHFLPGQDSLFFLVIEEPDRKIVFDGTGARLFTTNMDKIEYAGERYFVITKKDKRGLLDYTGKIIVQPEYDAIGKIQHGTVPVLRDKQFGFIDVRNKKLIKPVFDKNLLPYNTQWLTAFKDGYYGLIGWDNKPVTPFEFDEIQFWNDSVALVRTNVYWSLFDIRTKKKVLDKIKRFKTIRNDTVEKILIVQVENDYGVISNTHGVIIPATFSDIVNLGAAGKPFYFTEKHVEEASLFVVIYYDHQGKFLRRQVFEDDDYDKIYCSGN